MKVEDLWPPNRVVVDRDGMAVNASRAKHEFCAYPDIVFVRDDGWTLGAPLALERVAYRLWRDYWTHFARRGDELMSKISEYQETQGGE